MTDAISYEGVAASARAWWQALQPVRADGSPNPTGDRAALARLRRAATPADAMAEAATLDLFRRLGFGADDFHALRRVAAVAMALAHVRADTDPTAEGRRPPAVGAVGRHTPEDADSARMSPLRFRRLLATRELDELVREMRRLVALAGGRISVGDLAASLFFWGDGVRTHWAFEYYAAGAAAPRDDAAQPATTTST